MGEGGREYCMYHCSISLLFLVLYLIVFCLMDLKAKKKKEMNEIKISLKRFKAFYQNPKAQ